MSNFSDVGDFHEKFGLHAVHEMNLNGTRFPQSFTGIGPQEVTDELLQFRIKFLQEELQEFIDASQNDDHGKMFDALIDLVYVAMGTAHLEGYPWQEGWNLVQQANMAKVRAAKDGSDSVRGSAWDVVKPPGWTPPDIEGLLDSYAGSHDHGERRELDGNTRGPIFGSRAERFLGENE